MSNQLIKKDPSEGYKYVYPKTFIDAIKDRETGVSLSEILSGFNMYFLSYSGNKSLTRCKVPSYLRKEGLWITYVLYDHTVVTEWYNAEAIDDDSWGSDSNWRVASNALVGDVSISSDGYWVINGEKTEAKAQGEQGVTPLLRIGANNKLQVSYNAGKSWKDISSDITNNLRISKYIGINEALPTSGIAEGTIYMKGPYYDENDTNNDNPIYRMWVYAWKGDTLAWQDNGEFTSISAGVVQETGNSTTQVMSQDAVTRELAKLSEEVGELSDKLFTSTNLINPQEVDYGKYIYAGKLSNNTDYNTTGFISVKSGESYALIATGGHSQANARFISFFDEDKVWVSDGANYLKEVTIPNDVAFMRVSYDTLYWNVAQINLGDAIPFQDYAEIINPSLVKEIDFSKVNTLSSFRGSQALGASSLIELPLNFVSRNVEISASLTGNIQSIEVGLGKDTFFGGYIEITQQSISIYDGTTKVSTLEHGLTLGERIYVSIKTADAPNSYCNKTAVIVLRSNGKSYKTTSYFAARGKAFVKNNGSNSIEASISFFPCNATTPVWMFGDSYFEWADKTRWITQAVQDGNKKFMDCALSGGQSNTAMTAFANLLTLGLPKIAVWCLGMNDGNDSADAPSTLWLSNIKSFIAVCERNSITPVLATIPTVASVNNEKKNEWIRNSGHRYIDFAKAVGATSGGQWDEGLLSADGVHPSEQGGIMLYAQALVDCPEIANS